MARTTRPQQQGLYSPEYEHDACGVGFVAHIKGQASHDLIPMAAEVLINMTHRGAVGAEVNTGDGAGILTALPHHLLEQIAQEELQTTLPKRGTFAAGNIFLPQDEDERRRCEEAFQAIITEEGQQFLGWRDVPRDNSMIGPSALAAEPVIRQIFIAAHKDASEDQFERALYIIRKRATNQLRGSEHDRSHFFYICSLSTRNIVYKGMLTPEQLFQYYSDLQNPLFATHLAMVHSRFSTNTFPSWDRAQPLRFMSHNGEINTLRGNVNKMRAREGILRSPLFGDDIKKILPVIEPDLSDSGNFDNVLELLLMSGRQLPEAVMMMIPEAWQNHRHMPEHGRAMYEFMSAQMEPWDGPASVAFTDGRVIGAVLDRNGLRPSRFYVTKDDLVVMASEVGVATIDPAKVAYKGRLQPGRMFLVNFEEGRIVDDSELKDGIAQEYPFQQWLEEQRISLDEIPAGAPAAALDSETILERMRAFGFTLEHLQLILKPMAENSVEPLGSMGNDTPLAVLSDKPKMIYEYFKQLFAQVTNPPIDSIREEVIMSLGSYIGPEGNVLENSPEDAHRLWLDHPILSNQQLNNLRDMDYRGWKSIVIDTTFPADSEETGLEAALDRIADEVEAVITAGYSLAILSDRGASRDRIPVSALLATGAVHHRLVRNHKRTQIGIVVESGEPREVHHFCTLVGFGADAINPYLAYEAMWQLQIDKQIRADLSHEDIQEAYHYAIQKGMRKVFGKMGISTLESYKGAQIFEIVGLADEVVQKCFAGTASRIQGATFRQLAEEAMRRHRLAYPQGNAQIGSEYLNPGDYQWRYGGEKHMWDPESIADLQIAVRTGDRDAFSRFSARQNARSTSQATLRGLLKFTDGHTAVPLEEVEPAEEIMRRFVTGAMSYGSISIEAHETLAIAMNRVGGKSNTGEGGEDRRRYQPLPNGDSKRSAIKQVASGRFGVTSDYLVNADEIQIKISQGAKPGEGGELPGSKVYPWIAKVRHSTPGVGLVSPPPHHDIYSIEDLAELIHDLKNANPRARINVKLVAEVGVGTIAAGVAKAHADVILISGHDGGTGASPASSIYNAGAPWELGLAETNQILLLNNLRSRVILETDGQLKTGRDVAIAALLGSEEFGFATAPLVSMGCLMMRVCQKNTCPVGVATQDPRLRKNFTGKPEHVVHFMQFIATELRHIMAELGFKTIDDMVGHVEYLDTNEATSHWKAKGIDLTSVFHKPDVDDDIGTRCLIPQDHGLDQALDNTHLLKLCKPALERGEKVRIDLPITNINRVVGTITGSEITRRHGAEGLPEDTVYLRFTGSAGQSLAAFAPKGMTFELEGDANDYVGKGLSGGKIIIYPPRGSKFRPEEQIIIGNVAFYGATTGEAFINGIAGERFCVRNSGVKAVIEGVGDHGCEYMTGGEVIVLGATGRNFGAGMSGGVAYVFDKNDDFTTQLNRDMVNLYRLIECEDAEIAAVRARIQKHHDLTGSPRAAEILANWDAVLPKFQKVLPRDYERMLNAFKKVEQQGLSGDDAAMAAFEENLRDLARIGGN